MAIYSVKVRISASDSAGNKYKTSIAKGIAVSPDVRTPHKTIAEQVAHQLKSNVEAKHANVELVATIEVLAIERQKQDFTIQVS